MICFACRYGGKLNADANRATDEVTDEYLRNRALEAHGQCSGRCGCQHRVGQWRNERNDG